MRRPDPRVARLERLVEQLLPLAKSARRARLRGDLAKAASADEEVHDGTGEVAAIAADLVDERLGAGTSERIARETKREVERHGAAEVLRRELGS